MTYGTVCPAGHLPVYSVDTEDEARQLITAVCPTTLAGKSYAAILARKQSLANLDRFAQQLHWMYSRLRERDGRPLLDADNSPTFPA